MRVPEISLLDELQAQNEHDLYRYHKYKRKCQQTQYPTACTVSFMVVPSVRAWGFTLENYMNHQFQLFLTTGRIPLHICDMFPFTDFILFPDLEPEALISHRRPALDRTS